MTKYRNIKSKKSCWNRARSREQVFVLLGRDAASAATIRFWCALRIGLGKNRWEDKQIREAMQVAEKIAWKHSLPIDRA